MENVPFRPPTPTSNKTNKTLTNNQIPKGTKYLLYLTQLVLKVPIGEAIKGHLFLWCKN